MKVMTVIVRAVDGTCLDRFLLTNEKMFNIITRNVRECYGDDIMVESYKPRNLKKGK